MNPKPIAALLAAAAAMLVSGCRDEIPPQDPVRPVRSVTVGKPALQDGKSYTGSLAAHAYVNSAFEVTGRILRRYRSVGDRVKAGEALAELDPVLYRDQLSAAKADVRNARSQLQQAGLAYRRAKKLFAAKAASEQQLEAAKRGYEGAKAQLEAALATEHRASEQLSYTHLRARTSGRIVERFMEAGEVVAAGQPVYRIAADRGEDAVFSVPESDVKGLRLGETLRVCPLGSAQCTRAVIEEISPQASALTRTFQVKAHLAQTGAMSLGTTLECTLEPASEKFWRLPAAALTHEPGGADAVWMLDAGSGTVRLVPVQVHAYTASEALVSSGLAEGMKVVTAGVHVLREGQKVKEITDAAP